MGSKGPGVPGIAGGGIALSPRGLKVRKSVGVGAGPPKPRRLPPETLRSIAIRGEAIRSHERGACSHAATRQGHGAHTARDTRSQGTGSDRN